jgi:hypothetical protein
MFGKLAKHRDFQYTPRYYDPKKEEQEKGRPNISFRRMRRKTKTRPYIWLIAMLAFIIYLLFILSKYAVN